MNEEQQAGTEAERALLAFWKQDAKVWHEFASRQERFTPAEVEPTRAPADTFIRETPCVRCDGHKFYLSTGVCVTCAKARTGKRLTEARSAKRAAAAKKSRKAPSLRDPARTAAIAAREMNQARRVQRKVNRRLDRERHRAVHETRRVIPDIRDFSSG